MMTLFKSLNFFSTGETPEIMITEVLTSNDPRGNSKELEEVKVKEIDDLLKRGAF